MILGVVLVFFPSSGTAGGATSFRDLYPAHEDGTQPHAVDAGMLTPEGLASV